MQRLRVGLLEMETVWTQPAAVGFLCLLGDTPFYLSMRMFTTERMGGPWPTLSEVEIGQWVAD